MRLALLLATISAVSALTGLGLSDTLQVPGEYPSIQLAINAANPGDTVLVYPGTYQEQISFTGKAITVKSAEGPASTCIDGGNPVDPDLGSVVYFVFGEGHDSVLDGFTVTHGTGTLLSLVSSGGGIYCNHTSPTIRNNVITLNEAVSKDNYGNGGGIYCSGSSPRILNNTVSANASIIGGGIWCSGEKALITGNRVMRNMSLGSGGGICCTGASPEITDNRIHDNAALTLPGGGGGGVFCSGKAPLIAGNVVARNEANDGGGIYCSGQSPVITGNRIYENRADHLFSGHGGGIWCGHEEGAAVNAVVTNNLVFWNRAAWRGGGIYLGHWTPLPSKATSSSVLTNNTFYRNMAHQGGGMASNKTLPMVRNTIFWNDSANLGKEIWLSESMLDIAYSDVTDGMSGVEITMGSSLQWGSGMLDGDPGFVDVDGVDFHLYYHSPCRNAGASDAPHLPAQDFEGDPRNALGRVDMGGDEFFRHAYCTDEALPGAMVELKLVGEPGAGPVALFVGGALLDPPAPTSLGLLHLAPPFLIFSGFPPMPASGVLVLSDYLPRYPLGPYSLHFQGVIQYALTNLCTMMVQ